MGKSELSRTDCDRLGGGREGFEIRIAFRGHGRSEFWASHVPRRKLVRAGRTPGRYVRHPIRYVEICRHATNGPIHEKSPLWKRVTRDQY